MAKTPIPLTGAITQIKVACNDCTLFQLCLPVGLDRHELDLLDSIIQRRRPIDRGESLFSMREKFRSLFAVRSGSLKTYTLTEDGREQVTGFHLPGELVGLDAIGTGAHGCTAQALETTSVCEIPFDRMEELWARIPVLPRQIIDVMSNAMREENSLVTLLGKKSAEERLASFLLNLSERFSRRGYSSREFNLSMSRNDIANYLGLAVETVSRLFSRLQEEGVLVVDSRFVGVNDLERLRALAGSGAGASGRSANNGVV